MMPSVPIVKDLMLVGGGHAHVHVLKMFGMAPLPGVRLTLVTRDIETPYSGMIPGFVAGRYNFEECHLDLVRLGQFAGARVIHAEAVGIVRIAKRVLLRDRPPLAYDVLSLDIGSAPRHHDVPGAHRFAVPVKPIADLAVRWQALLERARGHRGTLRLITVGGGAGGIELTLAMRARLTGLAGDPGSQFTPHFTLVTAEALLPDTESGAASRLRRLLSERQIAVRENAPVISVQRGAVVLAGGETLAGDEILWVTQAATAPWLAETGLALDQEGFVQVGPTLQSTSDAAIFATGDCATIIGHKRPKAGVFAVRQGPPLAENLRRLLCDRPLRNFAPQRRYLALVGSGDGQAVAMRGRWSAEGRWAWRLKDWIDRRWMEKYRDLPAMNARALAREAEAPGQAPAEARALLTEASMRCGGCGAKVGATVLSRALARLNAPLDAPGVMIGLDQPDDAAVIVPPAGQALVQSLDFFRSFIGDPYLFGEIAANHALGDLHAMGAKAHSALALAVVPFAADAKVEDDLVQLLAGARHCLDEAGAALIGGHSSEGAELALGFAVNGFVDAAQAMRKGGLRAGDRLILTKPLGTGVIFAAAMRAAAKGAWIETALSAMRQSQLHAARIVRAHGASACTDVTGFGLIGHLVEMIRASGPIAVDLEVAAVPALDGALQLLDTGFTSSLQRANLHARHLIENPEAAGDAHLALLFDPQTAGGLLAGVPRHHEAQCLAALREAGYIAAAIGTVADRIGPAPIRLTRAS